MKYFKLIFDAANSSPDDVTLAVEDNYETKFKLNQYDISEGKQMKNWDKKIRFFYDIKNGDVFKDFLPNNLGWLIVSPKVQDILISCGCENIEFLSITIVEINSHKIHDNYKAVNILELVKAFDWVKSRYKKFKAKSKSILSVTHYTLFKKNIKKYDCFRIVENSLAVFISGKLQRLMMKKNITGVDYREINLS